MKTNRITGGISHMKTNRIKGGISSMNLDGEHLSINQDLRSPLMLHGLWVRQQIAEPGDNLHEI
jgi:hypothetical protein